MQLDIKMNDMADKRKNKPKALQAKAAENRNTVAGAARRGRGSLGAGRRVGTGIGRGDRGSGPGFRTRILTMLKNVEKGDSVVEGTEVGQKQLEKFLGFIDNLESRGRGTKLREKVNELLGPIESDDGFQFNEEGVNRLVEFLEQEPAQGGARAGVVGAGRAGRAGAGRWQGPGAFRGGAGPGRQKAQGGGGQLRKTIEELSKKVDALSKDAKS
jgi:hypothetical protein